MRSPHTNIHSTPFLGLLAGLASAPPARSTRTFAERWSAWLAWTDAIALAGVLGAQPAAARKADSPTERTPCQAVQRVRGTLADAITGDAAFDAGAAEFTSWRSRYQAHQRTMDTRIGPLRAEVRAALTARSAALARLAALDATLEHALGARERQLLATVPALLQKHFDGLHRAQGDTASAPWLSDFARQLRAVLLAELDLRLQPVIGMVETLDAAAEGER